MGEDYIRSLGLISDLYGTYIFVVAFVLFLVLFSFRKLNWTVAFLFINAICVSCYSFTAIVVSFLPEDAPPWRYTLLIAQCIKLLGDPARGIYLYKRCSPLMPCALRGRWSRVSMQITFWVCVAADTIAQGFHYLYGGELVPWGDREGTLVWVNRVYDNTILLWAFWTDCLIDVISCGIILAAVLRGMERTEKSSSLSAIVGHVMRASQIRIIFILVLGAARTILVFILPGGDFGTEAYTVSVLVQRYTLGAFIIFLLLESSHMLLYQSSLREQPRVSCSPNKQKRLEIRHIGNKKEPGTVEAGAPQIATLQRISALTLQFDPSPDGCEIDIAHV